MDPVSVIVAALAAGAGAGVSGAATETAYQAVKTRVKGWLTGRTGAELILAEHETDPQTWHLPLAKALTETGAGTDTDLVAAAQELLLLADPVGMRGGKYVIDVQNSQGTVIGDHSRVTQHYGVLGQP